MKLKHQGIILLGLPLACQLVFGTVLLQNMLKISEAGKKEAQAKEIISNCQIIRSSAMRVVMLLGAQKFSSNAHFYESVRALDSGTTQRALRLKTLVGEDKEASMLVNDYVEALKRLSELLADLFVKDYDKGEDWLLAQYASDAEYLEDAFYAYNQVIRTDGKLVQHYIPVVKEFQPKALAEQRGLITQIALVGVLNIITVISLGLLFGKTTLHRLRILMKNIRLFSKGEVQLVDIPGDDELAELHREFRQMAISRNDAEAKRRSIQAMVSHDLRTPLSSASLTLSLILLKDKDDLSPRIVEKMERLNSGILRLLRLADSFLDLEKIESGKMELNCQSVRVEEIFKGVLDAISGMAQVQSIKLEEEILIDEEINCDKDRVTQVLVNLASNALKFSPKDSIVTLRAELLEQKNIRFSVIDQGSGIPEQQMHQLFKRFSQLEQTAETKGLGSGFGLYVCQMIVECHGGTIGANNAATGGAIFWFEIPQLAKS